MTEAMSMPYVEITAGFYWARYEAQNWYERVIRQKQDWILVEVNGYEPLLEVYSGPYKSGSIPITVRYNEEVEGERDGATYRIILEWQLFFYDRVDGPPKEEE